MGQLRVELKDREPQRDAAGKNGEPDGPIRPRLESIRLRVRLEEFRKDAQGLASIDQDRDAPVLGLPGLQSPDEDFSGIRGAGGWGGARNEFGHGAIYFFSIR
jgi:hypothetical protein